MTVKKISSVFQSRMFALTVGLGILDIILYTLLFQYSAELNVLAKAVQQGEIIYLLVPLTLAMVFVLIHGTFTDYLWELLGLHAK
ncbi:hypothetical protein TI05_13230 [Achromatium sp. WMS3]|nr:hypothetical protein TI05_13230 [Achromatium sp. WMS3]